MSWNISSLISRLRREKKSGPNSHFDLKLLKQIKPAGLPTWSQFKYLGSFLSSLEKKIGLVTLAILFLTLISWGIYNISAHSVMAPQVGGEYSEALIGQPKYINPLFSSTSDVDADLTSLIYSGLFKYDNNKKIIPDLAEKVTVGKDQKTYDIELKENLKWSDGEPITINDLLFTFEAIQNAETGSPLIASFQGVRIEKTGENSIRFTLKTPLAPFLEVLTVGILPEHIWSDTAPASLHLAKFNLQPVGSGVWKFEKMVKDNSGTIQSYTISPNENYYGKKPYLDSVVFKFYGNVNEAITALRGQNVLGLSFVPHNLKDKVSGKNINIYPVKLPQYTALFFNKTVMTELKDIDLRKALTLAIDKKTIIEKALDSDAMTIDAPILPGNLGYHPDIAKIGFDPAAANLLLDKKWPRIQPEEYFKIRYEQIAKNLPTSTPENGAATSTEKTDDVRINELIRSEMTAGQIFYRKLGKTDILRLNITTADTPEYVNTAEQIAAMWRNIGIQTNIITVSSRQIVRDALKERNYEILIYGELIGADPDLYSFWHSSQNDYPGLNLAKFSDRDADKLLEDARSTSDINARIKLYQKFQDILAKEIPAIFLYTNTYIMAVSKEIKGITVDNLVSPQDRLSGLNEWFIKTKRQLQ